MTAILPGSHPGSGAPIVPVPAPGVFDPTLPSDPIGPPTPPGTPRTPGEANPSAFGNADAFWKWFAAMAIFWVVVVSLNQYGGQWAELGTAFAFLVLSTVLLSQGRQAIANAQTLFQ